MAITSQWIANGHHEFRRPAEVEPVPPGNDRTPGLVVQKYGGSSLATIDQIRRIARVVAGLHRSGRSTVVVVSARGRMTDDLLRLAERTGPRRTGRETDQLLATGEGVSAALFAIALQDLGVPAVSLTGGQAGIRATGKHGSGVICDIDTRRLRRILAEGQVAVVAGFQGIDDAGDVVTLGRGGSDTTAVALAAALGADPCEICTDVPGVATADPRIVKKARVLPAVDAEVMAEMSFTGARVLHSRAVELAARNAIELHVRSAQESSRTGPGTTIFTNRDKTVSESRGVVLAITHDLDTAQVLVRYGASRTDLTTDILMVLSAHAVPVDLVTRSGQLDSRFDLGFTIPRKGSDETLAALRKAMVGRGATIHADANVGKLSLIGMGLLNHPEYTARMLSTLAGASIPASWLSISQTRASVVVPLTRLVDAVRLLHDEFGLDRIGIDPASVGMRTTRP